MADMRVPSSLRCIVLSVCLAFAGVHAGNRLGARNESAAPAAGGVLSGRLTLAEYMQRVVEYNESVQARLLAFHAARSQRRAEAGTFEPAWVSTGTYVDRDQPNTIEIERSLRSGGVFSERNQNYSSAIEMQTPLGTRVRLGASAGKLINNIQRTVFIDLDAEYQSQVGISIEQPLLRGRGANASLAALRIAARTSEIAYQEYRRQLMTVVADAEMAYWQLYFAQQEVRLGAESVTLAETLVRDSSANLNAGRGSRLDVLEAEAGLALRRSRATLSRQRQVEAVNRLATYFGGGPRQGRSEFFEAAEAPALHRVEVSGVEGSRAAELMNPDYLRAQAQVGQEAVRLAFAKNQRMPQLDLKSSFAASGLGYDWTTAWRDVEHRDFPAWTVGLELRVPIWGDTRGRNEHRAAELRLVQAQRVEADVATQLSAAFDSALKRVDAAYHAAHGYQAVVEFRSSLLQTRLQGRDVGRLDSRSVLEAEQELFAARLDQLQGEIEHHRALLDLQVVSGTLLQSRGLELGFAELEVRTSAWSKRAAAQLPALQYRAPSFTHWPVARAIPFEGEPDPSHPWRTRLTRPLPWQQK